MGIAAMQRNALAANYTLTDDFQVTFHNNKRQMTAEGTGMSPQDILDISVVAVQLPQLGSTVESVMQAGEYRVYNAKFQPFSLSLTLRDFGSLDLRNYFSAIWMDSQRNYYDDVKSSIIVSVRGKVVFESNDCLITSVSQVDLNNSNTQVVEFNIEFTTPYYSNWQIKNFGSDAFERANNPPIAGGGGLIKDLTGKDSILGPIRSIANTIGGYF
jgi:hypothetical protein